MLASRETFASAVSGSLASMVALGLCYPLDRVRNVAQLRDGKHQTSFSIFKEILKYEGVEGLYTGLYYSLLVLGASNFVYFYVNAFLKAIYLQKMNKKISTETSNLLNLLFATISGIINVLTTTPLWVVATRLSTRSKKIDEIKLQVNSRKRENLLRRNSSFERSKLPEGLFSGMFYIATHEGISVLWSGTAASLLLVSNPAIQFSSYEKMRRLLFAFVSTRPDGTKRVNSLQYFLLGAISKMIATVLTYPLQLSQTRLRSYSIDEEDESSRPKSTLQCLAAIYRSHGILGWFKGMEVKLLQTTLTSAFMFAFYEKLFYLFRQILLARHITLT